jgi:transcriptional regulator with XRE-family HTH domain
MVNIEEFAKRLKIILNYYELSASSLADKIEVQRSSISHILSGRNKPSLEFVMKILKMFPEVELYWLLNGTGTFPKSKVISPAPTPTALEKSHPQLSNTDVNVIAQQGNREIERIVIFYKDGTFRNYNG